MSRKQAQRESASFALSPKWLFCEIVLTHLEDGRSLLDKINSSIIVANLSKDLESGDDTVVFLSLVVLLLEATNERDEILRRQVADTTERRERCDQEVDGELRNIAGSE